MREAAAIPELRSEIGRATAVRAPEADAESLQQPVTRLSGIGPRRADALARLGIVTIADLLQHYPLRHDDRRETVTLAAAPEGQTAGMIVRVDGFPQTERRGKRTITRLPIRDATGIGHAVWFNQTYIAANFRPGDELYLHGRVSLFRGGVQIESPEVEPLDAEDNLARGRLVPVYPLTETIGQRWLRRVIYTTLRAYHEAIPDHLPDDLRASLELMPRHRAVCHAHFPSDPDKAEAARRRLVFDEFFLLQLRLLCARGRSERSGASPVLAVDDAGHARFAAALPFPLTPAQSKACQAVGNDLASAQPTQRLLHGDVGAGKTVVAAFGCFIASRNGCQSALMAPTELLAEQHLSVLEALLAPAKVPVYLLTSSTATEERRQIQRRIAASEPCLVVGTHALLDAGIPWTKLAFCVVDEQHRFGAAQRGRLIERIPQPHLLVMTATPIPRTLALTAYGDLDVSVLNCLPPGRHPVRTEWLPNADGRQRAYRAARRELEQGGQVFVACPRIDGGDEDDETVAGAAAASLYQELTEGEFARFGVGLLHGGMTRSQRTETMERFRAGDLRVLVSTTVIEVGVDVPGASLMIVENAFRFGLAQLHQLRGRVGRGDRPARCLLLGDPPTPEGRARLESLVEIADGFALAERDLQMRGPGELCGTRQHGLPDFRLANLIRDEETLITARRAARQLLRTDPELSLTAHQRLREAVERGGFLAAAPA